MTLTAGSRLGPYEILGPLGAGGMGEVYRARDTRLSRDVAIKILPEAFSRDAERLRRFEHEARAAGVLNHPNLTAVYDIGTHEGAPYVVQELLEGETLRTALTAGTLPPRRAIEYGLGMARGLAAAHEKGIVHRDLKPENVFVTGDGRIKILDFGLAKLMPREESGSMTEIPTETAGTGPGVVLGTLGYMSPEQVRAQPADARSDIFSFGTILYEMLSGRRPFRGASAADTMSAILREDPPDLSLSNQDVSPGLEKVVRRCLEKSPERRFHSAHDLAFALEDLTDSSSTSALRPSLSGRRVSRALPLAGAVLVAAAIGAALWLSSRSAREAPPTYRQLTFRRGPIWSARFGPDGKTILYSASWDGGAADLYSGRVDSHESRPFGLPGADVLAVAATGEMAVLLQSDFSGLFFTRTGTLARVGATGGGVPREVLEGVHFADWAPDGQDLAVVRVISGRSRLEYPIGTVVYETRGWIGNPRFSPRGDAIAFVDHPVIIDDGGRAALVDLAQKKKVELSPLFASAQGLAWSPDGSEIWFTAAEVGGNKVLHAVTLSGRHRVLARGPGSMTLHDISRDGMALITADIQSVGIAALAPDGSERDLSWFDWSLVAELSADGRAVLLGESGEGGGPGYSVYIRGTDGSPAVRLGEGRPLSLSADGKHVLALLRPTSDQQLAIFPTGAGESRTLPADRLTIRAASFLPDGRRILMIAGEPERPTRFYVRDLESANARAVTPEGFGGFAVIVSADGKRFLARGPDRLFSIFPVDGGAPAEIPGLDPDDLVLGWGPNDEYLYVRKGRGLPARIVQRNLATGRTVAWRDVMPPDSTGVYGVFFFNFSRDGKSYAYNYRRLLSHLYVVEGAQ